jgi:2-dehydropantoate 2-reductase
MRIVVAGAGAIGSIFGGLLSAAGHDVLLIGRDPHMDAIERGGLHITGIFGACLARPRVARDLRSADAPADLLLVSVKSHGTERVSETLASWVHRPPLVVSLQNGLGNVETLARALGPEGVLGARVIFGALLPEAGRAHVTVIAKPTAIGPLAPDPRLGEAAARVASLAAAAGLPCEAVGAVEPLLWEKALYNCGLNPLGALHGLTYGEVASSPELRPLLDAAIDEGFAVARRRGIAFPWQTAGQFREYFHTTLLPPTAAHRSSMRQDLEAGRATEVDSIGGIIVSEGARLGIPTPVNRRLVDAIHAAERRSSAPRNA